MPCRIFKNYCATTNFAKKNLWNVRKNAVLQVFLRQGGRFFSSWGIDVLLLCSLVMCGCALSPILLPVYQKMCLECPLCLWGDDDPMSLLNFFSFPLSLSLSLFLLLYLYLMNTHSITLTIHALTHTTHTQTHTFFLLQG